MSNNIPKIQESILIELREDDSIKSTTEKNGEYTIHLQEPLTIKEGESIALKSGFVDSVAENSGQIFVSEEETNVKLDFYLYHSQIDMRGKVRNNIQSANYIGQDFNDCEPYLLCKKISSGQDITVVNSLTFSLGGETNGPDGNSRGNIDFHVKYQGVDSNFYTFSVKIPAVSTSDPTYTINTTTPDGNDNILLPINIKFGTKMFHNEAQDKKVLKKAGVRETPIQGTATIQNQDTLQPFLYSVSVNLQSGFYDPTQLQKVLTDKIQSVSASSTVTNQVFTQNRPSANNFLKTIDEIYEDFGLTAGTPDQKDDGLFLVRARDGGAVIQLPSGPNYPNNSGDAVTGAPKKYIIGCSDPAIEFDSDLKRFKLLLHTPLFDTSSTLVVKAVESNTMSASGNFRYSGSAGGAILSDVSPHSLFQKLGFLDTPDVKTGSQFSDNLLCNLTQVNHVSLGNFNNITTFKIINLEMGKNLTSAYTSVAVTYPTKGGFVPITLQDDVQNNTGSTAVTLEPIMAQNSINNISLQNPYFIIEVSGFDNKLKGVNNTFTNIASIVSRYQSVDNYTSFYNEGNTSVPYIHKGNPIQLNNFKVRILNPDKNLADNIGASNAIYLEHVKFK